MQVAVFVNFQHHCFISRFFVGAGNFFSPESPKTKSDPVEFKKISAWNKRQPLTARILRRTHSLYTHALFCSISHSLSLSLLHACTLSFVPHALTHLSHSPPSSPSTGCREIPGSRFSHREDDRECDRPSERGTEIDASSEHPMPGPSKPIPRPRQEREHQLLCVFLCSCPHATKIHFLLGSSCSLSSLSLSRSLSSSLTHALSPSLFLAHSVDWPDVCVSVCRWCLLMLLSLTLALSRFSSPSPLSWWSLGLHPSLASSFSCVRSRLPSSSVPVRWWQRTKLRFPESKTKQKKKLGSKKKIGTKKIISKLTTWRQPEQSKPLKDNQWFWKLIE